MYAYVDEYRCMYIYILSLLHVFTPAFVIIYNFCIVLIGHVLSSISK